MRGPLIDAIVFSPPYAIKETSKGSLTAQEGRVYQDKRKGRQGTQWEFSGQEILRHPSKENVANLSYGCTSPYNTAEYKPDPDHIIQFRSSAGLKPFQHFFSKESITHPAKANLFMLQWIIRNYTEPNETVLDPMAGTYSTCIMAVLLCRNAIGVEYEDKFYQVGLKNKAVLESYGSLSPRGEMVVLKGDARQLSHVLRKHQTEIDAIITSPPYSEIIATGKEDFNKYASGGKLRHVGKYSTDDKQIGNLPHGSIHAIVTSPPYEASVSQGEGPLAVKAPHASRGEFMETKYSENPDNLGNLSGETYLSAMLKVYSECYKVLKPNGVMVVITKNFIRNKKIVRLDLDTITLCEKAGFRLQERWYRKLTEQSFWRILYHKKFPKVPKIEYEDIIVFRKEVME